MSVAPLGLIIPNWPAPSWVRAGSTTRSGGISNGVFASLNLGDHVGDNPALVAENRALLQKVGQFASRASLVATSSWHQRFATFYMARSRRCC
ncbi:MAG: laccase domain-containing protein [Rheinheimera sp.]|nr:laccase domain-containing protein [Rheinheimera sp.]